MMAPCGNPCRQMAFHLHLHRQARLAIRLRPCRLMACLHRPCRLMACLHHPCRLMACRRRFRQCLSSSNGMAGGGKGKGTRQKGQSNAPPPQLLLQTSTDHVLGKVFRQNFSGRILSRIRENFSGTVVGCRGKSKRIFRYLRDLGENFGEKKPQDMVG